MDEAAIATELAKFPVEQAPAIQLDADDEGASAALFVALGTQWRTAGMSGIATGLDYAVIRPTAELIGVAVDGRRFTDLRLMEAEAMKVMTERARAEAGRR